MSSIDRRSFLAGVAAAGALPSLARAQAGGPPLQVFAHRVHKTVAVSEQGGDVTAAWAKANVPVEWTTFDTGPLQERLFREASLSRDHGRCRLRAQHAGAAAHRRPVRAPRRLSEARSDRRPCRHLPGPDEGHVGRRQRLAIPFRHASSGLHWNDGVAGRARLLSSAPRRSRNSPRSRRPAPTRATARPVRRPRHARRHLSERDRHRPRLGRRLHHPRLQGRRRPAADAERHQPAARLFRRAFPRNFAAHPERGCDAWMQRAGGVGPRRWAARGSTTTPPKSPFPGRIKTGADPGFEGAEGELSVAPAKVEFWGMAMPRNSTTRTSRGAYPAMLTRNSSRIPLNGNGPVRSSAYEDPGSGHLPYADAERGS